MNTALHILLMERNVGRRAITRKYLENGNTGIVVSEAGSFVEYNRLIKHNTYDLIITEPNIRGFNGKGVLATVMSAFDTLPVVVLKHKETGKILVNAGNNKGRERKEISLEVANLPDVILSVVKQNQLNRKLEYEYEQLKKLKRYYSTSRKINKIIASCREPERLLKKICEVVNGVSKYSFAWVGSYDPKNGTFVPCNWPKNEKKYFQKNVSKIFGSLFQELQLFDKKNLKNYYVCNDILAHNKLPVDFVTKMKSFCRAFIAFPLVVNNTLIGIFVMHSVKQNLFGKTEIEIITDLVQDVLLGVKKISSGKAQEKRNKDLLIAKEKAEQMEQLKNAFLLNINHEIRTPMNGILGFTELLNEPNLTGKQLCNYTEIINRSSKRMLDTVNNLINISKIESGEIDIKETKIDLTLFLSDVLNIYKKEAEQKGLKLYFNNKDCTKITDFKTDKLLFQFILSNLLMNSIKFTQEGYIELGYTIKKGYLEFFVKDSGIGIPREKFEVIFEKFRQCSEGYARKFEGSGLGLAIAKAYIQRLKGKIWVESNLGEGAIFYFTHPYSSLNKNQRS